MRESSPRSPVWVVLRYDGRDPAEVRWTVEDSSNGVSGGGQCGSGTATAGGSGVHAEWVATDASGWQRPVVFLVNHGRMSRMVARARGSALDRYADHQGAGGPSPQGRD